jgi:hypothetical protein
MKNAQIEMKEMKRITSSAGMTSKFPLLNSGGVARHDEVIDFLLKSVQSHNPFNPRFVQKISELLPAAKRQRSDKEKTSSLNFFPP